MTCSLPAIAQTQSDIDSARRQAETLQRVEQERRTREIEDARRRDRPVEGLDTRTLQPKIEVGPLDAVCRDIQTVTISGAPNLSWSMRGMVRSEFEGRCLGTPDIERLLGEITRDYIERGYITARAYLPSQDLSKGRLEILVVEGVVKTLRIEDGNRDSVSIGNAFPLVEGRLLNLRDLEQGIDQINRLQSNNATLDIQPGDKPGESEVIIKNDPKRFWRVGATWDNYGARTTGKHQRGANISLDSPMGLNEFVTLTYRESTNGNAAVSDSTSTSFLYSIPFGYSLFSVSSSRGTYASTITLPSGADILSNGSSAGDSVRLDRVVWRNQSTRFTLGSGVTAKTSHNFLGGQRLDVSSRNLTVLDLDGNVFTAMAGGTVGVDFGYAHGMRALGALQDSDELPDSAPRAQFGKTKFGANYMLPFKLFGEDWTFSSAFTGQRAQTTLYGSEQILIGGLFTVRGFERNTLAGDHGYFVRNELSLRKAFRFGEELVSGRVYAGYDFGSVQNRVANVPQGYLAGAAIGFGGQWRGFNFDTFVSRPLAEPESMRREPSHIWFRVGYTY